MDKRYYLEELKYLNEAGREFARAHPDEARYLNLDADSIADRDPDVERLFEGFAFLTGRIRERLDDELPEITEALLDLQWPHFLKPIPSCTILAFKPKPGMMQKTTPVPAGTEVCSDPAGHEGAVCRFRTTGDIGLSPVRIADVAHARQSSGGSTCTMTFELEQGVTYRDLALSPLRLYFHAEDPIASMMHLYFTSHVAKVVLGDGNTSLELDPAQAVQPAGFRESLIPYSPFSLAGSRLLLEYFSFRRKFWFVNLNGFEKLDLPKGATRFQYQVVFDRTYPQEKLFKAENIRLFCVPGINLFARDAEPLLMTHETSEYRVLPDALHPRSVEIYSINRATCIDKETLEGRDLKPYFSFSHEGGTNDRYYTSVRRPGLIPSDPFETRITIGGIPMIDGRLSEETVSMEVTCLNANLPREALQTGSLKTLTGFPEITTVENLTRPTQLLRSASHHEGNNYYWKLISHMALNYSSIASKETLVKLLHLYNWTTDPANTHRIDSIRNVACRPKEIIHRGAVLRGAEMEVEVQEDGFTDEGDLCLFGSVLSEFLSMYASINSFIHLSVLAKPSERKYGWKPMKGDRQAL